MRKITFLLGAGASRLAVPIVSEIPENLKMFRNHVVGSHLDRKYWEARAALTKDLESLIDTLEKSDERSIDSIARELWHEHDTIKYRKLKTCLSLFFLFIEKSIKPDRRYTDFYLKILSQGYQFPTNVKILTWNYDSQLESAYARLAKLPSIEQARAQLGVLSKHIFPRLEHGSGAWMPTAEGINIYKVNGTASVFHLPTGRAVANYTVDNVIEDICDKYKGCESQYSSAISFCWDREETNGAHIGVVDLAIQAVKDTEVLVVIGYSVPWYNKAVDHKILLSMSKLSRIIIQNPDAEGVKRKIQSLLPFSNIQCNTETDEFDLPIELLGL